MNVRYLLYAAFVVLAGVVTSVFLFPSDWMQWLGFSKAAYFTEGVNYAFFSGFGAWLSSTLGLSALVIAAWQHLNCHIDGCLRIGKFRVAGGYLVCMKHHAEVTGRHKSHLTTALMRELHHKHSDPPSGPDEGIPVAASPDPGVAQS